MIRYMRKKFTYSLLMQTQKLDFFVTMSLGREKWSKYAEHVKAYFVPDERK
jgi:hypothetical protein